MLRPEWKKINTKCFEYVLLRICGINMIIQDILRLRLRILLGWVSYYLIVYLYIEDL